MEPGHGHNGAPPNDLDNDDLQDEDELDPDDLVEVIDVDEGLPGEVADELGEMDLANDMGESDEDEGIDMEGGAEGGGFNPQRDDSALTFAKHEGAVFCVTTDPLQNQLACSGGEDDKGFVWDLNTGETVLECTGHRDSVTCVGFSHDSSFVSTADMSGLIKVWRLQSKEEVWSYEISDMEWLEWHHGTPVLFAGTIEGDMWMWKIPSGDTKTFQGHGCTCNIGKVLPDGKRLCAGYEDGQVKIWDLKSGQAMHTFTGNTGHEASVTSMDCHLDNMLVITGSTDVTAKLLNTSNGKVLATLSCSPAEEVGGAQGGGDDSVEAVGFSRVQNYAATGTLSGVLGFWDIPTQVCRHQCKHEAGIVRLRWDATSALVYTCTLDGTVNLWDSRSGKREAQWLGHTASILDMDISSNSSVLVTGSEDKTAKVFTLHAPER